MEVRRCCLLLLQKITTGTPTAKEIHIPLEAFISANTPASVYSLIKKGDLVSCEICIRNNNYRDKSGEQVYGLSLQIDTIKIMEPKHITDARHAESAA